MKMLFCLFAMMIVADACNMRNESQKSAPMVEVETDETYTVVGETKWNLVPDRSVINWRGFKPGGSHYGTIMPSGGYILTLDGEPQGGAMEVNMESLKVKDLEGEMMYKLENHLKGADFFDMEKFPIAMFEVTSIKMSDNDQYPYLVRGNMAIKDSIRSIAFMGRCYDIGDTLYVESDTFTLDRTEFGVLYKSKNIFKGLKDNFINDDIELKVNAKFIQ